MKSTFNIASDGHWRWWLAAAVFLCALAVAVSGLGEAYYPLITSLALAYLLFPVIVRLESWGLKRELVVAGVFILTLALILLVLVMLIPTLIADAQLFFKELPANLDKALTQLDLLFQRYDIQIPLDKASMVAFIKEHASQLSIETLGNVAIFIKNVFTNVVGFVIALLNILLFPLFFFFVINDYESIVSNVKSLVPLRWQDPLAEFLTKVNVILSGYIRGQLLVALILAGLYGAGLWLVGLKFGLFIGLLTGLLSIIPYVGFTLGFVSALVVALSTMDGYGVLVGVVTVFMVVQALESFVMTPRLVGGKVGINALTTIVALIIGGNLLGLFGMLLAIPTAGILKMIMVDAKRRYVKSGVYVGAG